MKLRWLTLLVLALLAGAAFGGRPTPVFLDVYGRAINSADWQNKWIIINYWAGWCEACAREIPQLNLFYQRHFKEVVLLGINYDNLPKDDLLSAVNSMRIHFPVLQLNPAKTLGLPAPNVLPTTFIINPQGKLIEPLYGPQTSEGLEEIINVHN